MMWTYHFSKKKKKWPLICGNGNGNAEIEGKKNWGNEFVAMALPKQEEEKNCGNDSLFGQTRS